MTRLHIVGGGWAGLSAAVHGVLAGHEVCLYDMAPQLGGRARQVNWGQLELDNGQHILTGACTHTLSLMSLVGADPETVLYRTPLQFTTPSGRMAPWLAHPGRWQRLMGLLSCSMLNWRERWAWLQCIVQLQWSRPASWHGKTAADWLAMNAHWTVQPWLEALCVSAMNLPASQADATVFLNLMQTSFESPQASDLLLPKVSLSELLPHRAADWLRARGAQVQLGQRITDLNPLLDTGRVVLACSAQEAARLSSGLSTEWSDMAQHIEHGPIATVYTRWSGSAPQLMDPLVIMPSGLDSPAQVVMDLGCLRASPQYGGIWSWVISFAQVDREEAARLVLQQAQSVWGRQPEVVACFLDPRATILCRPGLKRPGHHVGPGVWACGDYVESDLPSTLEGAIRSGFQAIEAIQSH